MVDERVSAVIIKRDIFNWIIEGKEKKKKLVSVYVGKEQE
jgi:hypothetical protein